MIGACAFFRHYLAFLGALVGVLLAGSALAECADGNVLLQAAIVSQSGVKHPGRLSDGWIAPDGSPNEVQEAVVFHGAKPKVTWELPGPTRVAAIDIQADFNDQYVILGSLDGREWKTFWDVPTADKQGLQTRAMRGLQETVRFIQLRARGGDGAYAVSDLRVFCRVPSLWPAPHFVRLATVENPHATETFNAFSGKIVVALLGLFLVFVVAPRVPRRFRNAILLSVIGLSALGWIHFGQFQGNAKGKGMLHEMDMLHYYVGSKYYQELGYLELYRCIAKWERERGNEDNYREIFIRDLDDNRLYPFSWSSTEAGRCRAEFSRERWKEFGRDIAVLRGRHVAPPFEHVMGDHGFNATPFHATWLWAVTNPTSPSDRTLRVLSQIDSMALLVAVFSLAWGFGLPVAAVAALVIQVGGPWSYNWVGGGLGRHVWFALCCLGIALLKQKCTGRGTAALTAAGLLRLFPMVFLGGLALYFASEWYRRRAFSQSMRRALLGFGLTLGLGFAIVLAFHGTEPLGSFYDKVTHHADAPAGNRLGFQHLLSLGPGKKSDDLIDYRLSDPSAPWKERVHLTQKERRPLWYLAVIASLGVLGWAVWTIRKPWVSVLAAGPLLYSLQDMTSYDYMWLVLLVPAGFARPRALKWLCGFAISTQVIMITWPDYEFRHWLYAVALFPTLLVFAGELIEWGRVESARRQGLENEKTPG